MAGSVAAMAATSQEMLSLNGTVQRATGRLKVPIGRRKSPSGGRRFFHEVKRLVGRRNCAIERQR